MARLGTTRNGEDYEVEYNAEDPLDKKRAFMDVFNLTSEEYDAQEEKHKRHMKELDEKYPALKGLVCVDGQMYYADDNGEKTGRELDMNAIAADMVSYHNKANPNDTIAITTTDEEGRMRNTSDLLRELQKGNEEEG